MRVVQALIVSVVCIGFLGPVFAAKDKEIPPWMEDVQEDSKSTYLIPAGAKRKTVGSQVIIEAPNEYVARRLYEMDQYLQKRLEDIEKNQKNLKEELGHLKKMVEELKVQKKEKQDYSVGQSPPLQ